MPGLGGQPDQPLPGDVELGQPTSTPAAPTGAAAEQAPVNGVAPPDEAVNSVAGADGAPRRKKTKKKWGSAASEGKASSSKSDAGSEEAPREQLPPIAYWKLFRTADHLDYLLMVIGTIGAVGNGALLPLFAIIFGRFTDAFGQGAVSGQEFLDLANSIALNFLYIALAGLVAAYLETSAWMLTGNRQANRLRKKYLASVLAQDVSFFDVSASTGGLLQGLNEDAALVQAAISDKVGLFIHHLSTFVAGYVIAFVKGWTLTLVMLATLPFLMVVGAFVAWAATTFQGRASEAYQKAGSVALQAMGQIRTVAAYNQQERAVKEYDGVLDNTVKIGIKVGWVTAFAYGVLQFVMFNTYAVALIYGVHRIIAGEYTGGSVLSVVIATLLGSFSLGQAAPCLTVFSKGCVGGANIFKLIDRKPAIMVDAPGEELPSLSGTIELRSVGFAYPSRPDVMIFSDFNLTVGAGTTVALVGSSGSGKSTVVGLIERFYDPLSGAVLLDGVDIRTLSLSWLRSQIGLVSQEPTLFATDIYENIAIGREGCTEQEVEDAARAANAHNFISSLPEGYRTSVGERGVQLSGGQKQRIAIARAILKNPKIMLLDEATSALDTESERIVQDALDRMIVGRTTVVVAHRLSTIKNADLIAVVKSGEIVEQGTHDELLEDPTGAYTTLVQLQLQQQAQGDDAEEEEEAVNPDEVPAEALAAASSGTLSDRHSLQLLDGHRSKSLDGPGSKLEMVVVEQPKEGTQIKAKRVGLRQRLLKSKKVEPEKKKEEVAPAVKVPMKRLLALNRPEWSWGVLGAAGSVVAGGVQPAFGFVIAGMVAIFYIIDPDEMLSQASLYCWLFFIMATAALGSITVQGWGFAVMGQNLSRRVRVMLFRSILRQEIGWHDVDENASGKLSTHLSTDAAHIRGAVGDTIGVTIQNLATMGVGYGIAFFYNWRVALLVTGCLPFLVAATIAQYKWSMGAGTDTDQVYAGANQLVTEAFASVRVIQAFNLQAYVRRQYARILRGADKAIVKQANMGGLAIGWSQFMMFGLYSLVVFFGGHEVESGRSTFDQLLKSFFAVLFAALGLAQAQLGFPDLNKAADAVQRVFTILDRTPATDPYSTAGAQPETIQGALALRDVTFAYPSRPTVMVFTNFSLTVPATKTVALVGESGSGKSTVVGLIERFYEPLSGQVLLDGVNLGSYNLAWLRKQIGLVSQEPLLFSSTILDNIRYGRPDASLEDVRAAAQAANALEFIDSLPEGFETYVGERGVQLSGGQKQRVAIARAVVKNPKILLLDEATSALDATSEKVVQLALDTIMQGRTSVVVAHRLSTIRNADSIAVVYRGTILEQGTHDELMELSSGGYARLVAAQMKQRTGVPRSKSGAALAAAAVADIDDDLADE